MNVAREPNRGPQGTRNLRAKARFASENDAEATV